MAKRTMGTNSGSMTAVEFVAERMIYEKWLRTYLDSRGAMEMSNRGLKRLLDLMIPLYIRRELSPRQRELLKLHMMGTNGTPMNMVQIAAYLGINKSTVCRTLKRAHQRLAHQMAYLMTGYKYMRDAAEEDAE